MTQTEAESVKELAKANNDVLEKLGWKWEPKVGEWFLDAVSGEIFLIDRDDVKDDSDCLHGYVIPILHWEEIERVLEGMGYELEVRMRECAISLQQSGDCVVLVGAESRQSAVMKAVIKLGEEIK